MDPWIIVFIVFTLALLAVAIRDWHHHIKHHHHAKQKYHDAMVKLGRRAEDRAALAAKDQHRRKSDLQPNGQPWHRRKDDPK
jgi:hypothetical protein